MSPTVGKIRWWVWAVSLLPIVILPLLAYLIRSGNFGVRNKAATGQTWTICTAAGDGCQFVGASGIQQAIDSASAGDTVEIKEGAYAFSGTPTAYADVYVNRPSQYKNVSSNRRLLVKNKALTITGAVGGNTVLDFGGAEYGLVLENAGASTIENLVLQGINSTQDPTSPEGGTIVVRQTGSTTATVTLKGLLVRPGSVTVPSGKVAWSHGVVAKDKSQVIITNAAFVSNTGTGVLGFDESQITIKNSLMVNNNDGTQTSNSGKLTVVNSIIANNTAANSPSATPSGIICGQSAKCTISYSDLFNNKNGNTHTWSGGTLTTGQGMTNVDPGLASRSSAYDPWKPYGPSGLSSDLGDPGITDHDGSRSDIGLFGGPDQCLVDNCSSGTPTPTATPSTTSTPTPTTSGCSTISPADYNGDCKVDLSDYQVFIQDYTKWITSKQYTERSDYDHNNAIGVSDYARFVQDYVSSQNSGT